MKKLVENFITELQKKELSKNTITSYKATINKFIKDNNISTSSQITKNMMINYKKALSSKYKIATVNQKIVATNKFLTYMDKHEAKIKNVKIQRDMALNDMLTMNDYERLLRYAKNERIKVIIQTLTMSGIRISELKYFTLEILKKKRIFINSKGKQRIIYISDTLIKVLKNYAKKYNVKDIIFTSRTGKAIDETIVHKELKETSGKARLKKSKVHCHAFRHLFAVEFMKVNHDVTVLANILGHSSLETTRIYTKLSDKEYRKSIDIFKNK